MSNLDCVIGDYLGQLGKLEQLGQLLSVYDDV